ncbi:MAG: hypothetical protein HY329_11425 [Chloroflexi bacterium]|nr:hypothetical protein [Chloroflexota bacterium]
MRARARQFHVQRGGRFDVVASMILIWTGALDVRVGESDIIGGFHIQPNTPAGGLATICRLEWSPEDGGSEEMLWRAIELLSGRFIRC